MCAPNNLEGGTARNTLSDEGVAILSNYPPVMTVDEVSEALRLSTGTVRRLLREGKLPGIHIEGSAFWRIPRAHLEQMLSGDAS
ncbi:MAG: helix-turn-helix domain-containing protein [Coriobacteriales bacterium]|jgi:excisionase family DNA binding protein|nr:helix-turn-helix domain-containing protein [Coriobacteriales bacterium]